MFNGNAFKTSLMFLGMILVALTIRMFLVEDSLFIKTDGENNMANIICFFKDTC